MKRLQLSESDRERLQSGPVTVRRAMRPEPGHECIEIVDTHDGDFEMQHYYSGGRVQRGHLGFIKPPFTPGEVVYVPEGWAVLRDEIPSPGITTLVYYRTAYEPPVWATEPKWRTAASMPSWAARLHARCVSVDAVKGERWEWVATFERCEPQGE